jgi:hypothetical protein
MFVDIVGFSQISDMLDPKDMFKHLAERMSEITAIIHEFRGEIDRSLGDGILCFFGGNQQTSSLNAFRAAQKIQEMSVTSAKLGSKAPLLPVRIGIHTADVVVGNLGGGLRVDYTMIGSGVNYASRLESAANPFRIIISKQMKDLLASANIANQGFSEIYIAVKHKTDLDLAYEFNPFWHNPEVLAQAEERHLSQLGLGAKDAKIHVSNATPIGLSSEFGTFDIIDFSLHGIRVRGEAFLGQKSVLTMQFTTNQVDTITTLTQKLLHIITVEVRWSKQVGTQFEHGLKIVGANTLQKEFLFFTLKFKHAELRAA